MYVKMYAVVVMCDMRRYIPQLQVAVDRHAQKEVCRALRGLLLPCLLRRQGQAVNSTLVCRVDPQNTATTAQVVQLEGTGPSQQHARAERAVRGSDCGERR